jgi:hypothetical protein
MRIAIHIRKHALMQDAATFATFIRCAAGATISVNVPRAMAMANLVVVTKSAKTSVMASVMIPVRIPVTVATPTTKRATTAATAAAPAQPANSVRRSIVAAPPQLPLALTLTLALALTLTLVLALTLTLALALTLTRRHRAPPHSS